MAYQISPLGYSYDALEPCIDAETMQLHHDKHHRSYVDLLNKAIENYPQFDNTTIEDLLEHLDQGHDRSCRWLELTRGQPAASGPSLQL